MAGIDPYIVGADSISARGRYSLPHTATGAYRMRPYGVWPGDARRIGRANDVRPYRVYAALLSR